MIDHAAERPLSPRDFMEALGDARLDAAIVGDYVLTDCHRLSEDDPICLELRGPTTLRIEVIPATADAQSRSCATAAGLAFSYRDPAQHEVGAVACQSLAAALVARLGDAPRRWRLRRLSQRDLPAAIAREVRGEPADLDDDPGVDLLRRDAYHYERLYGARPTGVQIFVADRPVPGRSVHYPRPQNGWTPSSAAVYEAPGHVARRRRMRRHFGALGCAFDDEAVPRTVPTPATFERILTTRAGLARIRPRLVALRGPFLSPTRWGAWVRRGILPITIAPRWAVELYRLARRSNTLRRLPCDVGMVVHDMSLHALGIHAVPALAWEALLRTAMERLERRGVRILGRLAGFFEGPLTRACWATWRSIDEPDDFASGFEPRFAALQAELAGL